MPDAIRVALRDDPNGHIGSRSIEQIDISSEEALNERLGVIFADSPWEVTARLAEGGNCTYYFKDRRGDPSPVTLLSSDNPPLLLRTGIASEQDVFLVPLSGDQWTKAVYDEKNRLISFEDYSGQGAKCELPGYFAVGVKDSVSQQQIQGQSYLPLSVTDSDFYSCDKKNVLSGEIHRSLCSPLSILVDTRCYKVPEPPEKKIDVEADAEISAILLSGRLAFDLSGSTTPSLYFDELFKKAIAGRIYMLSQVAEDIYIDQRCKNISSEEPEGCVQNSYKKLWKKRPQTMLGVTFYLGEDAVDIDIPFSLCEMTSCGKTSNYYEKMKDTEPLLDSLVRTIEEKAQTLTPTGHDFSAEMPTQGILEFKIYQTPYGQNIAGRQFQDVCITIDDRNICQSATDRKRVVDWSLENGLPLFLSISLAPVEGVPSHGFHPPLNPLLRQTTGGQASREGKIDFEIGSSDSEIEAAIRTLFAVPISDRGDDIYKRLAAICNDHERDRSASGSAAALLGAWALNGDAAARQILLELIFDPLNIASEDARTVVARTLALTINNEEAAAILNKIKAEPEATASSIYLSALAGHEEFLAGTKILLNSYHIELYEGDKPPAIVEAMMRVFVDPILQTGGLKLDIEPGERTLLAGNNWPSDLLQRVHEEIVFSQGLSTDETAEAMNFLIQLMQAYAFHSIPRETVERTELDVNTDLTKRHIYPGLGRAAIIRQGVRLARTAGREEGYLSIEPGDDEDGKPTAIEVGIFETEGSVSVPNLSDTEFKEFLGSAKVGSDDEWTMVDWHIHPIGKRNRHMLTDNIPSGADLLSYFYFVKEWKEKAPNVDFEFRILTAYGVLLLKPGKNFIDAVNNGLEKSYVDFVDDYESSLRYSGGQVTTARLRQMLEDLFEVEFETIK